MQEKKAVLKAGCKINLYLQITGVRADGWHELDTVFWPLSYPFDSLEVRLLSPDGGTVNVQCNVAGIDPAHNTLTTACARFAAASGFEPSLNIRLEKGIPHGAGLGGGSSDAAALLRWLNSQAPDPLTHSELIRVAAKVGADVPFFLQGVSCRATGIGERLVPCEPLRHLQPGSAIVLVCPSEMVSTPWAYKAWDQWQSQRQNALTKDEMKGIGRTSLHFMTEGEEVRLFENCFELPVFESFPRLRRLKEKLLQCGAAAAVMSGSGASLFGLFRNTEGARVAAEEMQEENVGVYVHVL